MQKRQSKEHTILEALEMENPKKLIANSVLRLFWGRNIAR
jgi:hypothetical protein